MQFFINEKMVEIINDVYCLTNFTKYQNQQGLERIREQKRIAQAKWRERSRLGLVGEREVGLLNMDCVDKKTSTSTSTDNLPSNSYSYSISTNNIYIQDNIEKEEENITKEEKEKDQTLVDNKDGMTYCQPTNVSTKTNSRSLNRTLSSYINECFDKTWKFVVNKKSKVYAQTTYLKKLKSCKTEADIKTKAKYILTKYVESKKEWEDENTELKYIPMFSTWLNRNIEDGVIHEEDL